MENCITDTPDGNVLLRVKVRPGSKEFSVGEICQWTDRLEIDLSEPATNGRANLELTDEIGKILNHSVEIKSGKRSRKKILLIEGTTKTELKRRLGIK